MKPALWMLAVGLTIGGVCSALLVTPSATPDPEENATPVPALVERRTLSSQTKVDGTLGHAGDYTVVNHLVGYLTWLPGTVVAPGEVLYRVGNLPVVLLNGEVPAWRELSLGAVGSDVAQLNGNLIALGFLDKEQLESAQAFEPATQRAVQALQAKLGVPPSGSLDLGHVVFLPAPLRVVSVLLPLGARADANVVLMKATSTSRQVVVHLTASQLKRVKVGDGVTITLNAGADEQTVPGRISKILSSADPGAGPGGTPTFEVNIVLVGGLPRGEIDQMPVQVGMVNAVVENALVVPISALLSTPDRGPVVEVLGSNGSRSLVPVQLGLFSDAEGLVQVTAEGLSVGDAVVVPSL